MFLTFQKKSDILISLDLAVLGIYMDYLFFGLFLWGRLIDPGKRPGVKTGEKWHGIRKD